MFRYSKASSDRSKTAFSEGIMGGSLSSVMGMYASSIPSSQLKIQLIRKPMNSRANKDKITALFMELGLYYINRTFFIVGFLGYRTERIQRNFVNQHVLVEKGNEHLHGRWNAAFVDGSWEGYLTPPRRQFYLVTR